MKVQTLHLIEFSIPIFLSATQLTDDLFVFYLYADIYPFFFFL